MPELTPRPPGHSPVRVYLPFALVLLVAVFGFVRIAQYHWREGGVLVAGALLVAAALRVVLSDEQAGLIAIRSRGVDALCYAGLGVLIMFVAFTIQGGPLG